MDTMEMDLISELLALQRGRCAWCETGWRHPVYSQCPKRLAELDAVAPSGFDDELTEWTEPTGDGGVTSGCRRMALKWGRTHDVSQPKEA